MSRNLATNNWTILRELNNATCCNTVSYNKRATGYAQNKSHLLEGKTARTSESKSLKYMNWLQQLADKEFDVVTFDDEFQSQAEMFIDKILLANNYISVICPECNLEYLPSDIEAQEWEHSKCYEGGLLFSCPKLHVIYATVDWITNPPQN
jgi:hypothetical protein